LAAREVSLQNKISEVHAFKEGLELREKKLHRAEQTVHASEADLELREKKLLQAERATQLLVRQHKDATELLDRLSAVGELLLKLNHARTQTSAALDIQLGGTRQSVLGALSSAIPDFVVRSIATNFNTDLGSINARIAYFIDTLQDVSIHAIICFSILKS
jgi:DNA primase large subunit